MTGGWMFCLASVVFDFDGVVLDSETPEYEAHRLIFARCGAELTVEEWCEGIGVLVDGHDELWHARLRARSANAPDRAAFEAERRRHFVALVSREPMAGITALLDALDAIGVPAAIASTAPARWVLDAAERIGIRHRFQTIVTCDDVTRRKPAPDVYLEALRRLGADAAASVAIEDSGPGIASAKAAGLKVVAVPHWLTARHDLSGADLRVPSAAAIIVQRLQELLEA
jgi:HAD superfamily hydrolase (TIGR01509 family)